MNSAESLVTTPRWGVGAVHPHMPERGMGPGRSAAVTVTVMAVLRVGLWV